MKSVSFSLVVLFLLLMGFFSPHAFAIKVSVRCVGDYCDGTYFTYIGLNPGDVIEDVAVIKNFEYTAENILVYHRQKVNSSGCGYALAQYSETLADAALWMSVPEYQGTIAPRGEINLPFKIEIPENAQPGGYGAAFLVQEYKEDTGSGEGIVILTRTGVRVYISIAGEAERVGEGSYNILEFIDIDGDKDLDRLEGESLFINDGGNFSLADESYEGFSGDLYFADIDGDEMPELFQRNAPDKVRMYKNHGTLADPDWQVENDEMVSTQSNYITGMTFYDVDKDEDLDLFLATMNGNLFFFQNEGNPQSPSWYRVSPNFVSAFTDLNEFNCPKRVAFIDIDGDQNKEMLIGEEYKIFAFKRNGDEQGTPWLHQPGALDFLGVDVNNRPTVADLDEDGLMELHVMSRFGRYMYEFPNEQAPGTGDLNGDGETNLADVIVGLNVLTGYPNGDVREDYATSDADIDGNDQISLVEPLGILRMISQ